MISFEAENRPENEQSIASAKGCNPD